MPRLRQIAITDSNAYAAVKNGDDFLFHKVKPKINDIHWWIHLISWCDYCAKAIWIEKDGIPTLHAIGTYKCIDLVKGWFGKWKQKIKYVILYTPIEIVADFYQGTIVYWCPLSEDARKHFDDSKFLKVCDDMEGLSYRYWKSGTFTAYCDTMSMDIDKINRKTPQGQAMRKIHNERYYYNVLGDSLEIPNYNTKGIIYK